MSAETDFRSLLLSDTDIAAIVGTRVDFGVREVDGGAPSIVLNVVSDFEVVQQDGPCGLQELVVQVDCYGPTYKTAKELSGLVRAALNGHSGSRFSGVFLQDADDGIEDGGNEGVRLFRSSLDFEAYWRE